MRVRTSAKMMNATQPGAHGPSQLRMFSGLRNPAGQVAERTDLDASGEVQVFEFVDSDVRKASFGDLGRAPRSTMTATATTQHQPRAALPLLSARNHRWLTCLRRRARRPATSGPSIRRCRPCALPSQTTNESSWRPRWRPRIIVVATGSAPSVAADSFVVKVRCGIKQCGTDEGRGLRIKRHRQSRRSSQPSRPLDRITLPNTTALSRICWRRASWWIERIPTCRKGSESRSNRLTPRCGRVCVRDDWHSCSAPARGPSR